VTDSRERIDERLATASRVWLFLDYDGTLADLAPTPAHITPKAEVVDLVSDLAHHSRIRLAVVSGRRLNDLKKLLPVSGIVLAGTYGVEMRTPQGETLHRVDFDAIRPALMDLRLRWQRLIGAHPHFFLEDKGWALALHARFAPDQEAACVLGKAEPMAIRTASAGPFRVLGGHKFLEIGPRHADKGMTVKYLLDRYPWPHALPLYLGDDDKDEAAFEVVRRHGGVALMIGKEPRETQADGLLASPRAVREWLRGLPDRIGQQDTSPPIAQRMRMAGPRAHEHHGEARGKP
jgi:trehalose 6-phosphate phosphatase